MTDGQVIGEYKAGDAKLREVMVSKRGNLVEK